MVDLAVLIYFIHHIAKSIQLPEVIAGIADDLMQSIDAEFPERVGGSGETPSRTLQAGKSVPELLALLEERGAAVPSQVSGYIQYVGYSQLIAIATRTDSVIRLEHRPGPLSRDRAISGDGLAARGGARGRARPLEGACDRSAPHPGAGSRLRHRPARRDRHPGPLRGGQRHLHRSYVHRLVVGWPRAGVGPDARRGRVPGRAGQRPTDRVGSLVRPHGQPRLRQDPPVRGEACRRSSSGSSTPSARSCSTPHARVSEPCCAGRRTWCMRLSERTVTEPNDLDEIRFRYRRLPARTASREKPHTWSKIEPPEARFEPVRAGQRARCRSRVWSSRPVPRWSSSCRGQPPVSSTSSSVLSCSWLVDVGRRRRRRRGRSCRLEPDARGRGGRAGRRRRNEGHGLAAHGGEARRGAGAEIGAAAGRVPALERRRGRRARQAAGAARRGWWRGATTRR